MLLLLVGAESNSITSANRVGVECKVLWIENVMFL
ncbi:unnamed protein product [Musa acuminata subsp. malaccensis]|uniref:(wild Malaysian banana) hypothetical protein n=1 Tax=Musa acuminata subsp. malaccensis TaxID=214687 RepID=A0A804J8C1_MUSAM|nr:unnamed protein product [Musa acuminata subsp. malaccensis]